MGRLTERNNDGTVFGVSNVSYMSYDEITAIFDKLAHYEDLEEQGKLVEQKHGRWIYKHDEEGNTGNVQYECSECGAGDLHAKSQEVPYCWKCGSYMLKELEE